MSRRLLLIAASLLTAPIAFAQTVQPPASVEYTADAKSLARYPIPSWFRSARFGILVHWGVASVPAKGSMYAREMYIPSDATTKNPIYDFHNATYGHPSEFGYKDLVPYWEAQTWNPTALVEFFKSIGARYVVVTAAGPDNFDNFDSKFQEWNSVRLGPKRDVVGDWRTAIRDAGLRFGVLSQANRAWINYRPAFGADYEGPKQNIPYDGQLQKRDGQGHWWDGLDPRDLYGPPRGGNPFAPLPSRLSPVQPPPPVYQENWYKRHAQLVDDYRPDLLFLDGPLPYGDRGLALAAHFLNLPKEKGPGKSDGILCLQVPQSSSPANAAGFVPFLKSASATTLKRNYWQTDIPLTEDDYMPGAPLIVDATQVIQTLCDAASKNGNVVLDVSLTAQGQLPANQSALLSEVGKWMATSGEAVLQTMTWTRYGAGTTHMQEGDNKQFRGDYQAGEVRFTTQGTFLYVMFLSWPRASHFEIPDLPGIHGAEWLGGGKAEWTATAQGASILLPTRPVNPHVSVLKIRIRAEDPLEF